MKRFKYVLSILLLITLIAIAIFNINSAKTEKVSLKGEEQNVYATMRKEINDNILREGKVNNENASYKITEEGKVIIYNYAEDVDCAIIEGTIDNYTIDGIDEKTFSHCKNLEMIKISKDIKEIQKIEDFEKNDELSDEQYTIYTTTKEYNSIYLNYLEQNEYERKQSLVPKKFKQTNKEKNQQTELRGLLVKDSNIPQSYFLGTNNVVNHNFSQYGGITIKVENQNPFPICRTFSTLKSFETNISLKYTAKKNNPEDFSELHIRFMAAKGYGSIFTQDIFAGRYVKETVGPVDESVLKYTDVVNWANDSNEAKKTIYKVCTADDDIPSNVTQTQINTAYNYIYSNSNNTTPSYYIMQVKEFPEVEPEDKNNQSQASYVKSVREMIKEHIMENGSVFSIIADPNTKYPNKNQFCFIQNPADPNIQQLTFYQKDHKYHTERNDFHGISLVGWDDNFSRENFTGIADIPEHNGAYLALNSYGDWGPQHGYFWISYDDIYVENMAEGVVRIENSKVDVSKISVNKIETQQYSGKEIKPQITCKLEVNDTETLEEHVDYEIVNMSSDNINVGKKKIKIKGINRFQGEKELEYEIIPRELTITIENASKKEGEADPKFSIVCSGALDTEKPNFVGDLKRAEGETAGTYKIEQGTFDMADNNSTGFKKSNYTLKFVPGVLEIKSEELSVTISEKYKEITDNGKKYITQIDPNTTRENILTIITTNGTKAWKDNATTGNATTGIILQVSLGGEKREYIITVKGDTNDDGKADLKDIMKINKHRLKKSLLEGAELLAGDVNQDNKADLNDIMRINKYRLGKISQL